MSFFMRSTITQTLFYNFFHHKVANNSKTTQQWKLKRKMRKCYLLYIAHLFIVASVMIFIVLVSKFFSTNFQHEARQFKTEITLA